jgi:hypothetical protein
MERKVSLHSNPLNHFTIYARRTIGKTRYLKKPVPTLEAFEIQDEAGKP